MKTMKKVSKTLNKIKTFLSKTFNNYKKMKEEIKKIWLLLALTLIVSACGVTKATVSKPAAGTSTTITITTNNPTTTEISPDVNLTK